MYEQLSNAFFVLLSLVAATASALLTVKPYAVVIVIVFIEKLNRKTTAIYEAMNINVYDI